MPFLLLLSLLATHVLSTPIEGRAAAPSVEIKNGTVIGSTLNGIDSFKGIPYAQPPVGQLRLRPPQSVTSSFGTITATAVPTSCPQLASQVNTSDLVSDAVGYLEDSPFFQKVSNAGEDCLTLNVQRPSTATSSSALPVVFWIFGGGFEFGSTSTYDASNFISKSVSLNSPVIYVAVNYRLNAFGFLAGKELSNEHSTNLGLRDQRLGLQWVQENIAAFGGDPSKVTIWGESAGSISVFDQTIINGGDNSYNGKALFRGGIMDSGSAVPADPVTAPQAQAIYDTVVENAGCSGSSDTLACLRTVDYTTFLNAANSVPGILTYRSVDLSYLPRPDPSDNFFSQSPEIPITQGNFAKVPVIIGDQEDEGTIFAIEQGNITTNDELITYLASYFPSDGTARSDVAALVANYPDEPLLGQPYGSPFGTGGANNIYPQFKRLAAILGDVTFILTRRTYLSLVSSHIKTWSYLSTYFHGLPVLGTFHASDLVYAYGILGEQEEPTESIQTYYISFINHLDPNVISTASPLIEWPQWSTSAPSLVNFQATENTILQDTFRQNASDYLQQNKSKFRV